MYLNILNIDTVNLNGGMNTNFKRYILNYDNIPLKYLRPLPNLAIKI